MVCVIVVKYLSFLLVASISLTVQVLVNHLIVIMAAWLKAKFEHLHISLRFFMRYRASLRDVDGF